MSSITNAKAVMGYVAASKRQACRNCHHGDECRADRMPPYDSVMWRCKLGGFVTSAGAICIKHEPRK